MVVSSLCRGLVYDIIWRVIKTILISTNTIPMDTTQPRYRAKSTRLMTWDYRKSGAYFITICCHDKQHYFGKITDNTMHYSPLGVIADVLWHEIKHHAKHITLGDYVVMPNHIHGILVLDNPSTKTEIIGSQRFQHQGKNSISSIVGAYKSAVSKHAHRLGYEFAWQPRFYDHIIRNKTSFNKITEYIHSNPQTWDSDRFYSL